MYLRQRLPPVKLELSLGFRSAPLDGTVFLQNHFSRVYRRRQKAVVEGSLDFPRYTLFSGVLSKLFRELTFEYAPTIKSNISSCLVKIA